MKNSNWKIRIILLVLLLPLLFINVKDSHDWGDDFAQYLIQARNITEGRPQTENGLVMNGPEVVYAVKAYTVGFPVLLAPVYYFFKLKILPYDIFLSLILFLIGFLWFEFFRRETNDSFALLMVVLLCYNPHIIELKKQILSEIPFIFFSVLALLWIRSPSSKNKYAWILSGFLFASLISIRLAGISLIGAYIILEIIKIAGSKKTEDKLQNSRRLVLSFLFTIAIFFFLNEILFPINVLSLFGFYSSAFQSHDIRIFDNLNNYYTISRNLFPHTGLWGSSLLILLAFSGWALRIKKSFSETELFLPFYFLIILFYPYAETGMRFLLPLLPLLLFYMGYFICKVACRFNDVIKMSGLILLMLLLIAYGRPLYEIISTQSEIEKGPQQNESLELFNYLLSTEDSSVFVFCKARAIALYTGRSSYYFAKEQKPEDSNLKLRIYPLHYLIQCKKSSGIEINDMKLSEYISVYKSQYDKVWENGAFIVYRNKR